MNKREWENPAALLNAEIRADQEAKKRAAAERARRIAERRAEHQARIARIQAGGPPSVRPAVTAAFADHPRTMVEVLARAAARRAA